MTGWYALNDPGYGELDRSGGARDAGKAKGDLKKIGEKKDAKHDLNGFRGHEIAADNTERSKAKSKDTSNPPSESNSKRPVITLAPSGETKRPRIGSPEDGQAVDTHRSVPNAATFEAQISDAVKKYEKALGQYAKASKPNTPEWKSARLMFHEVIDSLKFDYEQSKVSMRLIYASCLNLACMDESEKCNESALENLLNASKYIDKMPLDDENGRTQIELWSRIGSLARNYGNSWLTRIASEEVLKRSRSMGIRSGHTWWNCIAGLLESSFVLSDDYRCESLANASIRCNGQYLYGWLFRMLSSNNNEKNDIPAKRRNELPGDLDAALQHATKLRLNHKRLSNPKCSASIDNKRRNQIILSKKTLECLLETLLRNAMLQICAGSWKSIEMLYSSSTDTTQKPANGDSPKDNEELVFESESISKSDDKNGEVKSPEISVGPSSDCAVSNPATSEGTAVVKPLEMSPKKPVESRNRNQRSSKRVRIMKEEQVSMNESAKNCQTDIVMKSLPLSEQIMRVYFRNKHSAICNNNGEDKASLLRLGNVGEAPIEVLRDELLRLLSSRFALRPNFDVYYCSLLDETTTKSNGQVKTTKSKPVGHAKAPLDVKRSRLSEPDVIEKICEEINRLWIDPVEALFVSLKYMAIDKINLRDYRQDKIMELLLDALRLMEYCGLGLETRLAQAVNKCEFFYTAQLVTLYVAESFYVGFMDIAGTRSNKFSRQCFDMAASCCALLMRFREESFVYASEVSSLLYDLRLNWLAYNIAMESSFNEEFALRHLLATRNLFLYWLKIEENSESKNSSILDIPFCRAEPITLEQIDCEIRSIAAVGKIVELKDAFNDVERKSNIVVAPSIADQHKNSIKLAMEEIFDKLMNCYPMSYDGINLAPNVPKQEFVGRDVSVYWDGNDEYFDGTIVKFESSNDSKKQFLVHYKLDGVDEWEAMGDMKFICTKNDHGTIESVQSDKLSEDNERDCKPTACTGSQPVILESWLDFVDEERRRRKDLGPVEYSDSGNLSNALGQRQGINTNVRNHTVLDVLGACAQSSDRCRSRLCDFIFQLVRQMRVDGLGVGPLRNESELEKSVFKLADIDRIQLLERGVVCLSQNCSDWTSHVERSVKEQFFAFTLGAIAAVEHPKDYLDSILKISDSINGEACVKGYIFQFFSLGIRKILNFSDRGVLSTPTPRDLISFPFMTRIGDVLQTVLCTDEFSSIVSEVAKGDTVSIGKEVLESHLIMLLTFCLDAVDGFASRRIPLWMRVASLKLCNFLLKLFSSSEDDCDAGIRIITVACVAIKLAFGLERTTGFESYGALQKQFLLQLFSLLQNLVTLLASQSLILKLQLVLPCNAKLQLEAYRQDLLSDALLFLYGVMEFSDDFKTVRCGIWPEEAMKDYQTKCFDVSSIQASSETSLYSFQPKLLVSKEVHSNIESFHSSCGMIALKKFDGAGHGFMRFMLNHMESRLGNENSFTFANRAYMNQFIEYFALRLFSENGYGQHCSSISQILETGRLFRNSLRNLSSSVMKSEAVRKAVHYLLSESDDADQRAVPHSSCEISSTELCSRIFRYLSQTLAALAPRTALQMKISEVELCRQNRRAELDSLIIDLSYNPWRCISWFNAGVANIGILRMMDKSVCTAVLNVYEHFDVKRSQGRVFTPKAFLPSQVIESMDIFIEGLGTHLDDAVTCWEVVLYLTKKEIEAWCQEDDFCDEGFSPAWTNKVLTRFRGECDPETEWLSATITRVNDDNTFDLAYENIDELEFGVPRTALRPLSSKLHTLAQVPEIEEFHFDCVSLIGTLLYSSASWLKLIQPEAVQRTLDRSLAYFIEAEKLHSLISGFDSDTAAPDQTVHLFKYMIGRILEKAQKPPNVFLDYYLESLKLAPERGRDNALCRTEALYRLHAARAKCLAIDPLKYTSVVSSERYCFRPSLISILENGVDLEKQVIELVKDCLSAFESFVLDKQRASHRAVYRYAWTVLIFEKYLRIDESFENEARRAIQLFGLLLEKKPPPRFCAILYPEYTVKYDYFDQFSFTTERRRKKYLKLYIRLCGRVQETALLADLLQLLVEKKWEKDAHQETMLAAACDAAFELCTALSSPEAIQEPILSSEDSSFDAIDRKKLSFLEKAYSIYLDTHYLASIVINFQALEHHRNNLLKSSSEMLKCNFKAVSGESCDDDKVKNVCKKLWSNKTRKTGKQSS